MRASFPLFISASILLSTAYAFPRPESNTAAVTPRNVLLKRTEPNTGNDLPDTDQHPNQLDRVETGFQDAAEMASYVLSYIDGDTNIFPHYFNEADRANVKQVYNTIYGPNTAPDDEHPGNDLLGNVLVQTSDTLNLCGSLGTLAYFAGEDTGNPFIVLCPDAFKKKAVTELNGAGPDDQITCDDLLADGAHVSWKMNSLGATLFHEYT